MYPSSIETRNVRRTVRYFGHSITLKLWLPIYDLLMHFSFHRMNDSSPCRQWLPFRTFHSIKFDRKKTTHFNRTRCYYEGNVRCFLYSHVQRSRWKKQCLFFKHENGNQTPTTEHKLISRNKTATRISFKKEKWMREVEIILIESWINWKYCHGSSVQFLPAKIFQIKKLNGVKNSLELSHYFKSRNRIIQTYSHQFRWLEFRWRAFFSTQIVILLYLQIQ